MESTLKHIITGNELSQQTLTDLLFLASSMKSNMDSYESILSNKHIAIIFDKPSLRTRSSFVVAIHQLGGHYIECNEQFRKSELPQDIVRVLQSYCDGIVLRTHDDCNLQIMKEYAKVPIINALSKLHHPCQILADCLTMYEKFNHLDGLNLAYIGDGNNILHSLLLMATKLGVTIHYCCPPGHQPNELVIQEAISNGFEEKIKRFKHPYQAVKNAHAVYTDVWRSMGYDSINPDIFKGYIVDEKLMSQAHEHAIFMHCMPMNRGEEVSFTLPDNICSTVFLQAKNRLYIQKALLAYQFMEG